MKEQLTEYITKQGLSQVLKVMSGICDDKEQEQLTRNPTLSNKWRMAAVKLWQLAQKKSIETL
jgi:hypothetical protein